MWEALKDRPSGLSAIYDRMLLQIPTKQRELSHAFFRWVTIPVRPLQLQEPAVAADVQAFAPVITSEQASRDAVTLCGPFLKVQEQEVSLVHRRHETTCCAKSAAATQC